MIIQAMVFYAKWSDKGCCVWYNTTNTTLQLNWFTGLMHFKHIFKRSSTSLVSTNDKNMLYNGYKEEKKYTTFYIGSSVATNYIQFSINNWVLLSRLILWCTLWVLFGLVATP